MCRFALPLALVRRHHLLQLERRSGTGRRGKRRRTGDSDISFPLGWDCLVVCQDDEEAERWGRGRTTDSGGPSDTRVCVLPGPTGLAFCSRGQFGEQEVASIGLHPTDPHVNKQDVADDVVWKLLRHQLQRGSFLFVVAGPPSCTFAPPSQGPTARLWDPEVHFENARSAPVPSRAHAHRHSVGEAACGIVRSGDGISCLAAASLSQVLRSFFLFDALCRVGTCQSQTQATVSCYGALDARSGPASEGRPLGVGSWCAVSPVPGPEVVSNREDTTRVGRVQLH